MANQFTREERIMFDQMVEGFDDRLIIGKLAQKYTPLDPASMQNVGDKVWIPAPMIAASYDGFDQTANFGDMTDMAIPVTIGYHKSSNGKLQAKQLRNPMYLKQYGDAAQQKLSSDINYALFMTAALQGSVFIKRTTAPVGFDDVALADAAFSEIGVPAGERAATLAPRVYNGMASNLAKPQTSGLEESMTSLRKAYVGEIAGFETYRNDQTIRFAAAAGGATTINGANQYRVPAATSTASGTGETENVDNRYSDITVTSANYAGVKIGDAFTVAGVNSIHLITKLDTGQLQTFRVIGKPSANVIRVAPAIISGTGGTKPEMEYRNVTAAPADGAALTWLNTANAELNPFFVPGNLLLIPGSYSVDGADGWQVMRATTDLGIAITYVRKGEINDLSVKFRWDIDFGTSLTNSQMAGNIAFNQT